MSREVFLSVIAVCMAMLVTPMVIRSTHVLFLSVILNLTMTVDVTCG